jgi:preprotein translocase subunit SecD
MLLAIVGATAFSPGKWHHDFRVQLGLDLSSGTQVELKASTLKGKAPPAQYMKEAISVMIARVDGAGFSGAQIQQQGSDNILVTVPGASTNKVVNLVGATAQLYFRQVLLEGGPTATTTSSATPTPTSTSTTTPSPGATGTPKVGSSPSTGASTKAAVKGPQAAGSAGARLLAVAKPAATPTSSSSSTSSSSPTSSPLPLPTPSTPPVSQVSGDVTKVNPAVLKLFNQVNCNNVNGWKKQIGYTTTQYDDPNRQIVSCSVASQAQGITSNLKYVLAPAKVFGSDVTSAQAGVANQQQSLSGQWQVNLSLNGKGAAAFGALTEQMNSQYGNNGAPTSPLDQLAVVLDGVVVSAPQIDQGAITGGNAQITYFPQSQATQLAQELNYGELKVNLIKQDVSSVTPQLGRDQLVAGLIAAAIGLGLVVVYSFLYYRGLGLVSVSSLIIASILAFGSVVLLSKYSASGFSLSLAGIAGLIVAIGITADSFVVFFERLRDEVRDGRSLKPAVESGWKRARRTILVSDTVSFLCALLLWYFSVSDVKGFAFTLGLTTIIDIIVVFLFTKPMVTLLARTRFFSSGHPLSGLDPTRLGARAPWRSGVPRTASRVRGA